MLIEEDLSFVVIGAAIEVHRLLGPGLLESIYEECLSYELLLRGVRIERQVELPVIYKDLTLPRGLRIDLLVENSIVVELKAVEHIQPVHEAQLLSYLRLSRMRVGLLLNFNVPLLRDGVIRKVL